MNLANKLTLSRIVMAVFIIVLLLIPWNQLGIAFPVFLVNGKILIDSKYLATGIIFIIACITDFFDGYIARKNNEVSDIGACLDAIADKVLINGLLIILAYHGFINLAIPVIIITRDIVVDALKTLSAKNGIVVKANIWGKIKTCFMMMGVSLLLFYNVPFVLLNIKMDIILIYIATILSVFSAVIYYFEIMKTIKK